MPDISGTKISALDADTSISDSDYLAGVDAGSSPVKTKRFTLSALKTFFQSGLTKSSVGLGNVDNTSDADKPISTAQGTALNTLAANLAVVESSSTASASHAVGSYLVLGGVLYRVTTAIAAGETITPSVNVESTAVTEITSGITAMLGGVVLGVYEVPANTTRNLSFIKEVKGGVLIMSGGVSSKRGMYIYSSTSTGSVGVTAVLAVTQSGLSITGSGDDIVVVNGSNALFICVIAYKGALPTLTEPT